MLNTNEIIQSSFFSLKAKKIDLCLKRLFPFLFLIGSITNYTIGQELHTTPSCPSSSAKVDWGIGAGLVEWPEGSLGFTATDVQSSGHDFTFTVTGATGTLSDAAGIGVTPPGLADWGHSGIGGLKAYFGTSGIGTSINITIDISPPITGDVGFECFHINQYLAHGDHMVTTALDEFNNTIYASFSGTGSPDWTDLGNGEINATNNSSDNNAQLGVNLSSTNKIKQITLTWSDCDACAPPDLHGFSIGDIEFCYQASALPVELSRFTAKEEGCQVALNWVAESEDNFEQYVLEHSIDGARFKALSVIKGKGGDGKKTYRYMHKEVEGGRNYYRLKMVDVDGSFAYSKTKMVQSDCQGQNVSIYPNPFSKENSKLNISFYAAHPENEMMITNVFGKVVKQWTAVAEDNTKNTVQADISDLPTGVYYFRIVGSLESNMFVVQK